MHGPHEPGVGIADDEPDTRQATSHERADEGRPGRPFVVPGRQLESEDATLTAGRHAGGHERRHVHDAAAITDLHVRGVQPEVGIGLTGQGAAAEGLDLGVERGTDAADLAPARSVMPRVSTRSSTRRVETPRT